MIAKIIMKTTKATCTTITKSAKCKQFIFSLFALTSAVVLPSLTQTCTCVRTRTNKNKMYLIMSTNFHISFHSIMKVAKRKKKEKWEMITCSHALSWNDHHHHCDHAHRHNNNNRIIMWYSQLTSHSAFFIMLRSVCVSESSLLIPTHIPIKMTAKMRIFRENEWRMQCSGTI